MLKKSMGLITKDKNEIYQAITENSPDAIAVIDKEYRFTCFNNVYQQHFKQVFGKNITIGMSLMELLDDLPEEQAKAITIWGKALKGENFSTEAEFSDVQQGQYVYQIYTNSLRDTDNQIIGASQIARNITLLKKFEHNVLELNMDLKERVKEQIQQLSEQEQLTKTITDNTTSALFMMDAKGYPTFMNPAAERITGYTLDEIKHRPLHYAIHYKYPDGRPYPMEECPLDNSSVELTPMQNQEEVFVDKNGRLFPVVWSIAPLEKNGHTLGAVIEFRDVTLEKKIEAERLDALKKAQEEERQRAQQAIEYRVKQEEFIDTICHEIRNPLNGIYGGAELVKDNLTKLDSLFKTGSGNLVTGITEQIYQVLYEAKQNVEIIEKCAQQQKNIADDVLDLSKLEQKRIELNPIVFNLKERVLLVVKMFAPQLNQKNLKLNVNIEDKWVKADAHRFTQIMTNLISNAVKFTQEGSINIYIVSKPVDGNYLDLAIKVTDTGIGMHTEEIPKLFERFTQANRYTASEFGGSGLGLAITKKLVEAMGGNIHVKSQKWHGTCFEFNLKVSALSLQEQQQENDLAKLNKAAPALKASAKIGEGSSKRILIVEDNTVNQKILINFLNKKGHLYEVANNGLQAVEKYEQFIFDCIFMDIEMPVMNGLEATKQIRLKENKIKATEQGLRYTPIIGLSGNARKEQIQIALDAGMDDYITKPFHPEEVYQKIIEATSIQQTVEDKMETSLAQESLMKEQSLQGLSSNYLPGSRTFQSLLFSQPAKTAVKPKENVFTSTMTSDDFMEQAPKKLRVSSLKNADGDLPIEATNMTNLIDACASAFKTAANELLAQAFTFELTNQQNALSITLLKEPHITPYMAKFILKDLKQSIENSLIGFNIEEISLLHNQLIIIANPASMFDLHACLIKTGLFSKKDYLASDSSSMLKSANSGPLLSCANTLFVCRK